jgi:hypothetical protein
MTALPVTRDEALRLGVRRYMPGTACGKGHVAPRQTKTRNCVECVRERCRVWYERNSDLAKQRSRASKLSNPERTRENGRRFRDRNKLPVNLRSRLAAFARRNGLSIDPAAAIEFLGCPIDDFRLYLEARFQPGMSWDNWSLTGWHIDHIRPLLAFDLSTEGGLRAACHYTNLQPLWSYQNLQKRRDDLALARDRQPFQARHRERNERLVTLFLAGGDLHATAAALGMGVGSVRRASTGQEGRGAGAA